MIQKEPKKLVISIKPKDNPKLVITHSHLQETPCILCNKSVKEPMTSQKEPTMEWEKEFDKWFGHGENGHLHGLLAEDYYKEVKLFISKLTHKIRKEAEREMVEKIEKMKIPNDWNKGNLTKKRVRDILDRLGTLIELYNRGINDILDSLTKK